MAAVRRGAEALPAKNHHHAHLHKHTPSPRSAFQVYGAEKPFPLDRAAFVLSRHGAAAVIFVGIFFNAALFLGIWLYKEWNPEPDFDEMEDEGYPEEDAEADGKLHTE